MSAGWLDRVREEAAELLVRLSKLHAFISSPAFAELPERQRQLLGEQLAVMTQYHVILKLRITHAEAQT